jgi:hypothetical protein
MAARGDRIQLTPDQEQLARSALAAGATADVAAIAAGITYQRLKWALYETGQLGDVRVGQGRRGSIRPIHHCLEPTEAEIERMKVEIRRRKGDIPPA